MLAAADLPALEPPGTRWGYLDEGYALLGKVIEGVRLFRRVGPLPR
ncbi:serine hydrolase [Candidatus Bipolaricaulota bacterium]|nr:serine hydrolase [Candidatus Bipolaricaulota bacterium]